MTTAYQVLAKVTLQHDYYTDGRCNDFDIVPNAATAAALQGLGIRWKMVDNVLLLLVKVKTNETVATENGKPYIDIPQGLKLTFYVDLVNANFVNFTNVPYQPQNTIFYFTNVYKTKIGSQYYINKQLPAFSNAGNYLIGNMVHDGANNVFEALKQPLSGGSHSTSDGNWWYKRDHQQYVGTDDAITITEGRLTVPVASAAIFDIDLFSMDPVTFDYTVAAGSTQHLEFADNQLAVPVATDGLLPGKYRVRINGADRFFLLDKDATYKRYFGIIELYHSFSNGNDLAWLDGSGKPKAIEYIIRFANRLVLWKYIVHSDEITGIEDTDKPGAFQEALLPHQFISVNPLPLKQQPVKTLQLLKNFAVVINKLPNPGPLNIGTYTDGSNNQYYCAEMYLNQ